MPACTRVPNAPLRFAVFSFILVSLTIIGAVASMTTVPAMTEHVHRDECDEDQYPEPVCCKPCHDYSPFGLSPRIVVTAWSRERR